MEKAWSLRLGRFAGLLQALKLLLAACTLLATACASGGVDEVYFINNQLFNISPTKSHARETTDGINAALRDAHKKGYKKVRLAKGKYLIQSVNNERWADPSDGIFVPSNTQLDLTDVELYLEPNGFEVYGMIQLLHVENVEIVGGHLIGDREAHSYDAYKVHEHGHGINIVGSKNITIRGVRVEQTVADAIILTSDSYRVSNNPCRSIRIYDCELHSCRRQGISIVDAEEVEIARNTIHHIGGIVPGFAIDVEPEVSYGCVAKHIKIHHNYLSSCTGGISFHGGTDSEAFDNHADGLCLIAVFAQRIKLYRNTVTSPGYISAGKGSAARPCTDICIPTTGANKNTCTTVVNQSIQTGTYSCS